MQILSLEIFILPNDNIHIHNSQVHSDFESLYLVKDLS